MLAVMSLSNVEGVGRVVGQPELAPCAAWFHAEWWRWQRCHSGLTAAADIQARLRAVRRWQRMATHRLCESLLVLRVLLVAEHGFVLLRSCWSAAP